MQIHGEFVWSFTCARLSWCSSWTRIGSQVDERSTSSSHVNPTSFIWEKVREAAIQLPLSVSHYSPLLGVEASEGIAEVDKVELVAASSSSLDRRHVFPFSLFQCRLSMSPLLNSRPQPHVAPL
jgi:hypothetical protein